MKQTDPLSLGRLAGAGWSVIGTLVVGLLLGLGADRLWHWAWAVPLGILLGFAAGLFAMFRQISGQMR
jgi:Putative F0F1-ATPase subunit Ca2+/Mg2+ transporter